MGKCVFRFRFGVRWNSHLIFFAKAQYQVSAENLSNIPRLKNASALRSRELTLGLTSPKHQHCVCCMNNEHVMQVMPVLNITSYLKVTLEGYPICPLYPKYPYFFLGCNTLRKWCMSKHEHHAGGFQLKCNYQQHRKGHKLLSGKVYTTVYATVCVKNRRS